MSSIDNNTYYDVNRINSYFEILGETGLTSEEIAFLDKLNPPNYNEDCLSIYLVAVLLRWRGACKNDLIDKLQKIADGYTCNLNINNIVNGYNQQVWCGGIKY